MDAFVKSPFNPIYGGPSTGTLFDVLVTRDNGKYRMDFSWRPQKSLAGLQTHSWRKHRSLSQTVLK